MTEITVERLPTITKTPVVVDRLTEGATAISHAPFTLVEVLEDGEVVAELPVADGNVTHDGKAATRSRLDLAVVDDGTLVPNSPTDLLAPYGNELRVSRGVEFADRIEVVRLGIFRIYQTTISESGEGVGIQITAQDRSSRVIDANFEDSHQIASGTLFTTAILSVVTGAYPDVESSFVGLSTTTPSLISEAGEDRWAFAQGLATALGLDLFFDGEGVLVLDALGAGASVADLVEGEDGVLLEVTREWSREGAFNRVIVTGENTGEAAASRGVATDSNPNSPTYYYGSFGQAPRFWSSEYVTSDAQAAAAAATILQKELGTTESVSFGAVVDPSLRPGDVVQITRAIAGVDELHTIDSITIPLSAEGSMTGATRAVQVT